MTGEREHNISDLLHRLNSADAGSAWSEFIDHYAPLIMKLVCQFEYEQDRGNECFLYVCEKLCDFQFRRLQKFNTAGKASFSTWLGAVIFNLCVDWHRKQFGRVQMLPAISGLPAFDQKVYQLSFEQVMPLEVCYQTLKSDFPDLTRQQLSSAIGRVHDVLSPRQRWQISVRNRRRRKQDVDPDLLTSPEAGPQKNAESIQASEDLHQAMKQLSPNQRLLLQLRFRQGLTLKSISEIMQLGDPFRARRKLHKALDALSERMQAGLIFRKK